MSGSEGSSGGGEPATSSTEKKKKEKARVSRTSLILWKTHQNDKSAVRKLLEEDPTLVQARDYDNRTPLHVAALHGWIDIAKCLIEYGADVNSQDRWRNTVRSPASHLYENCIFFVFEMMMRSKNFFFRNSSWKNFCWLRVYNLGLLLCMNVDKVSIHLSLFKILNPVFDKDFYIRNE